MKTFRICEEEIKDLKPVAVGYKIFKNDWTSKIGGYDYKDENGNVLNTIHKVGGDVEECRWGLHFSLKPQDCFNFYECVQWNKFAKVEAYDQLLTCDKKCVTNIMKIVEVYTFDEFIKLIQEDLQNNDIRGGENIYGGNDIYGGDYIRGGNDIYGGNCIRGGNNIYGGNCIRGGNNILGGNNIEGGNCIYGGNNIEGGNCIYGGNCIRGGNNIEGGNDIRGGENIYGGNCIYGGNDIWGARECEGISRAIFCYKKSGKLMAFNKKITEERFNEIFGKLNKFGWYPKFNNAEQLKGNLEWYETNIPAIVSVDNKTAWSFMPKEMLDYIKSLPEFNEKIFNKIIGD